MPIKKIKEIDVRGKKVLLRCDLNVPLNKKKEASDNLRILQLLPTVNYLLNKKAKVILLSHRSEKLKKVRSFKEPRNKKKKIDEGSIYPVKKTLSLLLNREVKFIGDCVGEEVRREVENMEEGEILLLENVRMYKEEKENSREFAKEIASLADVFINDAFSVSHRNHASVSSIPLFLPSAMGMLMEKEIKVLSKIGKNPERPVVAIIGGSKVESKITVIKNFLKETEHVLLGGKIANTMLIVRKVAFNLPLPEKKIVEEVKKINYTSPKIHLPVDVVTSVYNGRKREIRETAPGKVGREEDIFDVGEETRALFGEIIREAGTVIWAGPLGFFEERGFEKGTKEIGEHVAANKKALKVVGGGDTGKALKKFGLLEKMDHVSSGGGAMLAYLGKEEMPGIKSLEK